MVLARILSGEQPGDIQLVSETAFKDICTVKVSDVSFIKHEEAVHWLSVGRIGSHWQMGNFIYIKIKNEKDDPYSYYTPPKKQMTTPGSSWCSTGKGCCGSGGCSSGGCGTCP